MSGDEIIEGLPYWNIGFDLRAIRLYRLDLFGKQVFINQYLYIGLVEHVLQFIRRIQHRHVDQHAARFRCPEKDDAVFGAVARNDADLFTLFQAEPRQRMGKTVGLGIQVGIGRVPAFPDNRRFIRKTRGRAAQHIACQHDPVPLPFIRCVL